MLIPDLETGREEGGTSLPSPPSHLSLSSSPDRQTDISAPSEIQRIRRSWTGTTRDPTTQVQGQEGRSASINRPSTSFVPYPFDSHLFSRHLFTITTSLTPLSLPTRLSRRLNYLFISFTQRRRRAKGKLEEKLTRRRWSEWGISEVIGRCDV